MNKDIKKGVGKKIRSLRTAKRLTQEELGEKAGISYKFVGEIERGEVNPSLDSLAGIARALGVDIKELFPGEAERNSPFSAEDLKVIEKALKLLRGVSSKIK